MTTNTYIAGHGLYYAFDVRAKLLFTVLMCIVVFCIPSLTVLSLIALAVIILVCSQVGWKDGWHDIALVLPLLAFMLLLMPFSYRDGETLLSWNSILLVSKESFQVTAALMLRFLSISLCCVLLIQTASNTDLLLALRWYRLPYALCLMLSLSLRFIPTLASTFTEIRESQSLRLPSPGTDEKKRGRFRSLVPTLTSVLVCALRGVPDTASALESRGFGRKEKRTSFHQLSSSPFLFTHFALGVIIPITLLLLGRS